MRCESVANDVTPRDTFLNGDGAEKTVNRYLLKRPEAARRRKRFTAVDLFSGAGGITLGLLNSDFDVVFCSDFNQACERTHKHNFPTIRFARERIENLQGPD